MEAKGEVFAKQFEAKVEEATALLEKLSDADWKKTTPAEKWTVAATAHHVATSATGENPSRRCMFILYSLWSVWIQARSISE